ncbi:MAG TPA: histidine kinase, partial [Bacteroidales bacterium]|nr:histidine kinase [Bacteroidales bacterium]
TNINTIVVDDTTYFFVLHNYTGTEPYKSKALLFDTKGELIKEVNIKKGALLPNFLLTTSNEKDRIHLLLQDGNHYSVDTSLVFKKKRSIHEAYFNFKGYRHDLDLDGEKEFVFFNPILSEIQIVESTYNRFYIEDLLSMKRSPFVSCMLNEEGAFLSVDTESYLYQYSYTKSWIHAHAGLVFIIILIIVIVSYFIAEKVKDYIKLRRKDKKSKIYALQLKAIQNQLDPHFAFNVLQSFGNLIEEQDHVKANFIFTNYTRMLKSVVINSDEIFIPLKQEIKFVQNYLELEAYRNDNRFVYNFDIPKAVRQDVIIPKMLIHTFVENAVKHGVRHLNTGGEIAVSLQELPDRYQLKIRDNGVGLNRASNLTCNSTGKGLLLIKDIIKLYNQLYRKNIYHEISDLEEIANTRGTLVTIHIPLN